MKIFLIIVAVFSGNILFSAPEIAFSPTSFNFGNYPSNQEKEHVFSVQNTGDEVLVIEKIRNSCGCSVAEISKKELAPGEQTDLAIKILTESIAGPFSKGIFVHSNASNGKIKMVTVNGNSEALVTVLPQNNIYIGTVKAGERVEQEFIFKTLQTTKFGIPEIIGESKAEIIVETEEKQLNVRFVCTPELETSVFKFIIKIPILEPENWKPVELNIQGRVVK